MKCPKCGKEMTTRRFKDGNLYYACMDCRLRKRIPEEDSFTDVDSISPEKPKLNKLLIVAFILGLAYLIYSMVYWSGTAFSGQNAAEQIGTGLATALVFPHLIMTGLAILFNALGLFLKNRGLALTAGILYSVAMLCFPFYFFFVVIQAILCYIAFAKMKKKI